jgi:hypothetical protein
MTLSRLWLKNIEVTPERGHENSSWSNYDRPVGVTMTLSRLWLKNIEVTPERGHENSSWSNYDSLNGDERENYLA